VTIETGLEQTAFYEDIASHQLTPLWHHARELLPAEPAPRAVAAHWPYAVVRDALLRADTLIDPSEAERRVLLLTNPGLAPVVATTPALLAGVQLLLPGEVARAHRHTATAVRFIIEGRGAYTVTDGEPTSMDPGDLVLTPGWTWHDHESQATEPVLWLDGLDVPLVRWLEAGFFELHRDLRQPVTKPIDHSKRHFVHGTLRAETAWERRYSPVVNYPWPATAAALSALAVEAGTGGETGMLTVDYVNPMTGGPVTPTIGCRAHLLQPGQTSTGRRETASAIVHVVSGEGVSRVGDTEIEWSQGDVFVVPGWAEASHANRSGHAPAMLFAMTDEPALRALDLYRSA
jgi:gentisate 1,2-dioxygenase